MWKAKFEPILRALIGAFVNCHCVYSYTLHDQQFRKSEGQDCSHQLGLGVHRPVVAPGVAAAPGMVIAPGIMMAPEKVVAPGMVEGKTLSPWVYREGGHQDRMWVHAGM